MRPLLLLSLCATSLGLGGCNRAHLYKNAGIATVNAFTQQSSPNPAPRPRTLDGAEAAMIIGAERQGFVQGEDGPNGPPGSGAGAGKPSGIALQAR